MDAFVAQLARKRYGAAAAAEQQAGQAGPPHGAEAAINRPRHSRGRDRGVDFLVEEFFPDGGPTDFAGKLNLQSTLGENPEFPRGDQRGAFERRDETEPQATLAGAVRPVSDSWFGEPHVLSFSTRRAKRGAGRG